MKKSIETTPNIETLFGTRDENVHVLEDGLNINIDLRSDSIELEGAAGDVARAQQVFSDYQYLIGSGFTFNNGDLNAGLPACDRARRWPFYERRSPVSLCRIFRCVVWGTRASFALGLLRGG